MLKTKSLAKQKLYEFLKNADGEKPYHLAVSMEDVTIDEVTSFVHRMRVELSRMRKQVSERTNRMPKPFKVLFVNHYVQTDKDGEKEIVIVLRKSSGLKGRIAEGVNEIFDTIAGGEKIDG